MKLLILCGFFGPLYVGPPGPHGMPGANGTQGIVPLIGIQCIISTI